MVLSGFDVLFVFLANPRVCFMLLVFFSSKICWVFQKEKRMLVANRNHFALPFNCDWCFSFGLRS